MPQALVPFLGTALGSLAANAVAQQLFSNNAGSQAVGQQTFQNTLADRRGALAATGIGPRSTQASTLPLAANTAATAAQAQNQAAVTNAQTAQMAQLQQLMQGSKNLANQNDYAKGYGSGGTGKEGTGYGQPGSRQGGTVPTDTQPAGTTPTTGNVDPTTGQPTDGTDTTTMGGMPFDLAFNPTFGNYGNIPFTQTDIPFSNASTSGFGGTAATDATAAAGGTAAADTAAATPDLGTLGAF
jgi:hypothetical protein